MTDTKDRPKSQLTDFGAALYSLLLPRGMRSLAELSAKMEAAGDPIARQSLAAYANGTRRVPPSFAPRITPVLGLSEEEMDSLSKAIAYGQPDERFKFRGT